MELGVCEVIGLAAYGGCVHQQGSCRGGGFMSAGFL